MEAEIEEPEERGGRGLASYWPGHFPAVAVPQALLVIQASIQTFPWRSEAPAETYYGAKAMSASQESCDQTLSGSLLHLGTVWSVGRAP